MAVRTFTDAFAKLSLGQNGIWQAAYWWTEPTSQDIIADEASWFVDPTNPLLVTVNPFSVAGGVLSITASATPPAAAHIINKPYTSGLLTTYDSFAQLYGYFEITAKMAVGAGLKSDFWLLPADPTLSTTELDVFEVLGNNPSDIVMSYHSDTTEVGQYYSQIPTAGTAYHRYGVDWQKDYLKYFIDGKIVAQTPTPADMNRPMYVLLQEDVGTPDSWEGAPLKNMPPTTFQVANFTSYAGDPNVVADSHAASVVSPANLSLLLSTDSPQTPWFIVSVDGVNLTDAPVSVTASHGLGSKTVSFNDVKLIPGLHHLSVHLVNDPTSSTTLYVDHLSYNGTAIPAPLGAIHATTPVDVLFNS